MIFSNQASRPMEEVAGVLGDAPHWFQLYWSTSNELVESLVARAEACGCEAIVVTLDTTLLGWRPRDLEPAPTCRSCAARESPSTRATRCFTRLLLRAARAAGSRATAATRTCAAVAHADRAARAYPARFWPSLRSGRGRAAVQRFVEIYSRPSLTWEDLPFLRERTKLPIVLKGILHPEDARARVEAGVDGIVVSNHGGRQVDGAIATIDALPRDRGACAGRVPVLLDSGIRGGADAFKALALGARAVLIGRPYVYGLAVAGRRGAGGAREFPRRLRPHDGPRRLPLDRGDLRRGAGRGAEHVLRGAASVKELHGSAGGLVAASVEDCVALLRAVEDYPRWHPALVREVEVVDRDEEGCPSVARATLHVSVGPFAQDFHLLLRISADESTVTLTRIAHEPSDAEALAVRWRVQAGPPAHVTVELDAKLDVPRLLPVGGAGDAMARDFVASAATKLAS